MPDPLADIGRLIGAEANRNVHRLFPHHAEALGAIALSVELAIDLELVVGDAQGAKAVDSERRRRFVGWHFADAVQPAGDADQPVRIVGILFRSWTGR